MEAWPAPDVPLPGLQSATEALRAYVAHMEKLLPTLPADPGNDEIMPLYKKISRMWRQAVPGDVPDGMEILSLFKVKPSKAVVQRNYRKVRNKRWRNWSGGMNSWPPSRPVGGDLASERGDYASHPAGSRCTNNASRKQVS